MPKNDVLCFSVSVNIRVKITDVNDNAPYFEQTQYSIEVKENFYIDQTINPAIEVKDLDECKKTVYLLTPPTPQPGSVYVSLTLFFKFFFLI